MTREIPVGWTKVDKYAMKKGDMSICRVYVSGEMVWEFYKGNGPAVYRGLDSEGGYAEAVETAKAMEKKK